MKKLTFILLAITLIASSCKKDDSTPDIIPGGNITPTTGSLSMTYDGQTFTEVDDDSMTLLNGTIAVAGANDDFLLTIIGIGADGTTTEICTDYETCANMCTLTLDFGASIGLEALVATSGTIKRNGKTLEVNVTGLTIAGDQKTLSATIVCSLILDY